MAAKNNNKIYTNINLTQVHHSCRLLTRIEHASGISDEGLVADVAEDLYVKLLK